MGDLLALAKRCEAATGPDRELDEHIEFTLLPRGYALPGTSLPYTASIDAAMTLVPEGFDWIIARANGGLTIHAEVGSREQVFGETPALALCAAALRARDPEGLAHHRIASQAELVEALQGLLARQGYGEPRLSDGRLMGDESVVNILCTLGDIRRARAAIAKDAPTSP